MSIFQFTPLREGRLQTASCQCRMSHFNSRPSARGDCNTEGIFDPRFISIHAPPRGATVLLHLVPALVEFQFTPLREGRLRRNPAA